MKPNFLNRSLFVIIPLVGIVIVGVFLISYGIESPGYSLKMMIHGIMMTAGLWLGCMTIVIYLWRRFPWEKAPLKHLFLEILLILAYTLAFSFMMYLLEDKYWKLHEMKNPALEIFLTILITLFITAIHESLFFYYQWKLNFSKSVRLEKDNLEARYEALKAQINPHFLFNSLNSLITMVEDNRTAVEYVQDLSDLLRYMLKSGEKELVLVRDEITILKKYVSLQQARYAGSLDIRISVEEKYYHYAIPPLTLQMLVENSIKHNIISSEKPLSVEVIAEKESLIVVNNLQRRSGVESSGQGLKNIIGRYEFFTSRKVDITETDKIFKVAIPLLQVEL